MHVRERIVLFGTFVLCGCLVGQDLGETAGSESGSGDGSSGGPSSATDDASVSQSNTSAQPGDDSSSVSASDVTTVGDATDSVGDSDTASDGSSGDGTIPDECPLGPDSVRLQWNGPVDFDPIDGVPASFAAALVGGCTMQMASSQTGQDPDEYAFGLLLQCTLDGQIDGQPVVAQPHAIDVDMVSADIDPALLPFATAEDVQLRFAADFWGMGWGVWFVIAREDGTILLDVIDGPFESPTAPSVGVADDVMELIEGEPWHGGLFVNATPTKCAPGVDECGGEQRAIELGWDGTPQVEIEVEQLGMITTDIEETWYRAHVRNARAYPMPMCTDLPEADYAVTIWAEEP